MLKNGKGGSAPQAQAEAEQRGPNDGASRERQRRNARAPGANRRLQPLDCGAVGGPEGRILPFPQLMQIGEMTLDLLRLLEGARVFLFGADALAALEQELGQGLLEGILRLGEAAFKRSHGLEGFLLAPLG